MNEYSFEFDISEITIETPVGDIIKNCGCLLCNGVHIMTKIKGHLVVVSGINLGDYIILKNWTLISNKQLVYTSNG